MVRVKIDGKTKIMTQYEYNILKLQWEIRQQVMAAAAARLKKMKEREKRFTNPTNFRRMLRKSSDENVFWYYNCMMGKNGMIHKDDRDDCYKAKGMINRSKDKNTLRAIIWDERKSRLTWWNTPWLGDD